MANNQSDAPTHTPSAPIHLSVGPSPEGAKFFSLEEFLDYEMGLRDVRAIFAVAMDPGVDLARRRRAAIDANRGARAQAEAIEALCDETMPPGLRARAERLVREAAFMANETHAYCVALRAAAAPLAYISPRRRDYDRADELLRAACRFADRADAGDLVAALRAKLLAEQAERILSSHCSIHVAPRDDLDRWCYRDKCFAWSLACRMHSMVRHRRPRLHPLHGLRDVAPLNDSRAA